MNHGCVSTNLQETPLELTNRRRGVLRDVLEYIMRNDQIRQLCLLRQNCDSRLQVRVLQIRIEPPLEAGTKAILQGLKLAWWAVRRQHNLVIGLVQGIERMEELFLCTFLALQELDVIDDEHVQIAVATLEGFLGVVTHGINEVVGELFRGNVANPQVRVQMLGVVANAVEQVRLAKTRTAGDKQRVVGAPRRLRNSDGGRGGELILRTNNEGLEGVVRVEGGLLERHAHLGWSAVALGTERTCDLALISNSHRILGR